MAMPPSVIVATSMLTDTASPPLPQMRCSNTGRTARSAAVVRSRNSSSARSAAEDIAVLGDLVEECTVERDPDAGPRWHRHDAVGGLELLLGDVAMVRAAGGRGVARVHESGQRCQVDVVGAPDACLEHAPAPHRHTTIDAQLVHTLSRRQTAEPADLDVDDGACAEVERGPHTRRRVE